MLGIFLTSFILALRAEVVTKLLRISISFLTSFIVELRVVLAAELVKLGFLSSIFFDLIYLHFTCIFTHFK